MKAYGTLARIPDRFGKPAGIVAETFSHLPDEMQREAVAMLREMGLSDLEASQHLHLSPSEIERLVDTKTAPFQRGGELTLAGDHEGKVK